jgi:hypothetical protein
MTAWRSESRVETRLVSRVRFAGGACEKFKSSVRGEPDRLLSFPWGFHCLVETKWARGVKPEPHQLRRHEYWRDRGMPVFVVGDEDGIDIVLAAAVSANRGPVPDQS